MIKWVSERDSDLFTQPFVGHYVFLLGAYRALYIVNWVYRSYHEPRYVHNWVVYICGIIQTCLYVDFFYYYIQRLVTDFMFVLKYLGRDLNCLKAI